MTNKQKLKTFEEHFNTAWEYKCPDCGEGIGNRHSLVPCIRPHTIYEGPRFVATQEMLTAHHEAILSLQKEIDALSSQLKALQNPKDSEVELKKLLKTKL